MTITDYLNGKGDHNSGLELLAKHDPKNPLYFVLRTNTPYNQSRLKTILADINSNFNNARTKQDNSQNNNSFSAKAQNTRLNRPFPIKLQPAVNRIKELYAQVNYLHPLLDTIYNQDRKRCFDSVIALLHAWTEIDGIWRLIDYFDKHNVVLPNKYAPQDSHLPIDRAELMRLRSNLRSNISKHKNNPKKQTKIASWKSELNQINTRLKHAV